MALKPFICFFGFTKAAKGFGAGAGPVAHDFNAVAGTGDVLGRCGDFDFFFAVADAGDVGLGGVVLGFAGFALKAGIGK